MLGMVFNLPKVKQFEIRQKQAVNCDLISVLFEMSAQYMK